MEKLLSPKSAESSMPSIANGTSRTSLVFLFHDWNDSHVSPDVAEPAQDPGIVPLCVWVATFSRISVAKAPNSRSASLPGVMAKNELFYAVFCHGICCRICCRRQSITLHRSTSRCIVPTGSVCPCLSVFCSICRAKPERCIRLITYR
jgi:hypothetical protein